MGKEIEEACPELVFKKKYKQKCIEKENILLSLNHPTIRNKEKWLMTDPQHHKHYL